MEQRRANGKSHWYHETQSSASPDDVLPLVPEAAHVADRFLLDLPAVEPLIAAGEGWLPAAAALAAHLLPDTVAVNRLHTFSAYDRLCAALTVAQVCGVQRLCNHYAARLAPLPGPDSSRESNRRLAQITQYARQLASSPSLIDAQARMQLADVGLTAHDILLINQIVGFVGFQARVLALAQAWLGYPARWLPGMPAQEAADAAPFTAAECGWRPDLPGPELRCADAGEQEALARWRPPPELAELAPLLAGDPQTLQALATLFEALNRKSPFRELLALAAARLNGSVSCFNRYARRWRGDPALLAALREGEQREQAWSLAHPRECAILQAARLLTLSPGRFSAAQLTPLAEQEVAPRPAIAMLGWCSLHGWLNRLKIALGDKC